MERDRPLLLQAVPALAGRPWVRLVPTATALEPAPDLGRSLGIPDLWLKRDDRTAARYGGNKVRQLEWILGGARARGADRVLTAGALGSNWVLATAVHAPRVGLPVEAFLYPQPDGEHVRRNLLADLAAGADLRLAGSVAGALGRLAVRAARLRAGGGRPHVVLPGGLAPGRAGGVLGYLDAGLELAHQIRRGDLSPPEAVHLPAGTMATLGGLALGLSLAGLGSIRLVGYRVVPAALANRAVLRTHLVAARQALERAAGGRLPAPLRLGRRVEIVGDAYGGGYGKVTGSGLRMVEAFSERGIRLEPVYGAKAAAGMVDRHRGEGGRHLLWLTASEHVPEAGETEEEALDRLLP